MGRDFSLRYAPFRMTAFVGFNEFPEPLTRFRDSESQFEEMSISIATASTSRWHVDCKTYLVLIVNSKLYGFGNGFSYLASRLLFRDSHGAPRFRKDQMSYNRQSRRSVSKPKWIGKSRWSKRRRRHSKSSTPIFSALVIEGLAVAFILYLFFNVRADLNRQANRRMMWDTNESSQLMTQEMESESLESLPVQVTGRQWDSRWNQFHSAN